MTSKALVPGGLAVTGSPSGGLVLAERALEAAEAIGNTDPHASQRPVSPGSADRFRHFAVRQAGCPSFTYFAISRLHRLIRHGYSSVLALAIKPCQKKYVPPRLF